MLDIVAQAIDRFYTKKEHDAFKVACAKQMELSEEIKACIERNGLYLNGEYDHNYPSIRWSVDFAKYKKGKFKISYRTVLQISKVTRLFHIQHEFEIKNRDKKRIAPSLDEYGDEPYCKKQREFAKEVSSLLKKRGYCELSSSDMGEVVTGFEKPEGVAILGSQITVEHLLFSDLFEMCNIHCCSRMDTFLEEPNTSIFYSDAARDYYIAPKKNAIGQPLIYCPWCAQKLPESLRYKYYNILESEYGIVIRLGMEKSKGFPKEFKSDEWWKNRGL